MRMLNAHQIKLDRNVRSTPELVDFIESLIDVEYAAEALRTDAEVASAQLIRVADETEMDATLPMVVQLLRNDGWLDEEILILSPRRIGAAQRNSNPRFAELLSDSNEPGTGVKAGTIHKFTGLESPAVILTDVSTASEDDRNLLYVGATRATDRLTVLMTSGE